MGFSAEWLALREPADRAARDDGLLARAVQAAGLRPVLLDLGCGTGATLRALEPHLPEGALWHLVDHDPALLAQARTGAPGRTRAHGVDLGNLDALPLQEVTMVTASALLDLMPEAWVADLAARLAQAGLPFYATLSYDGMMNWDQPLPQDAAITRAFNDHQRRDKGLGPALGPDAAPHTAQLFRAQGFEVELAASPWQLSAADAPLYHALIEGIAQAAREQGEPGAAEWGRLRADLVPDSRCRIGHVDLLALPPGAS